MGMMTHGLNCAVGHLSEVCAETHFQFYTASLHEVKKGHWSLERRPLVLFTSLLNMWKVPETISYNRKL